MLIIITHLFQNIVGLHDEKLTLCITSSTINHMDFKYYLMKALEESLLDGICVFIIFAFAQFLFDNVDLVDKDFGYIMRTSVSHNTSYAINSSDRFCSCATRLDTLGPYYLILFFISICLKNIIVEV